MTNLTDAQRKVLEKMAEGAHIELKHGKAGLYSPELAFEEYVHGATFMALLRRRLIAREGPISYIADEYVITALGRAALEGEDG